MPHPDDAERKARGPAASCEKALPLPPGAFGASAWLIEAAAKHGAQGQRAIGGNARGDATVGRTNLEDRSFASFLPGAISDLLGR